MSLWYGIIVPPKEFWKIYTESYLGNTKRIFKDSISEFLYRKLKELEDQGIDMEPIDEETMNDIEEKALQIIINNKYNINEYLLPDNIEYSYLKDKKYIFVGIELEDFYYDYIYPLDYEFKLPKHVSRFLTKYNLDQFNPKIFYNKGNYETLNNLRLVGNMAEKTKM